MIASLASVLFFFLACLFVPLPGTTHMRRVIPGSTRRRKKKKNRERETILTITYQLTNFLATSHFSCIFFPSPPFSSFFFF